MYAACIWYVGMHVCMGVYDLALGCVYGIAHRELRTCAVSFFSHTCAYRLASTYIGVEGVQHIAAELAHNTTLHTLK
jgi:hypothetical protein